MAEANGNGLRSYLPLAITVVLAAAPALVIGGQLLSRVDNLEAAVKERAAGLQTHMDNLADAANARWQARDRQAETGDQRLRTLGELLIAQQRDFIAMAGTDSRQDEAIKQALARLDRLIERFNEVERAVRPYQLPGPTQR